MVDNEQTLTNAAGIPLASNTVCKTVGKQGPLLLEDYTLLEKMAHFNRERIPERVVHAIGAGAYGTFTVTEDITRYTKAKMFSEVGKQTELFARFSTVAKSKGGSDIYRDLRGFSLKFYTEDGNWDMVGNNTPIFFVRDPMKFMDFIRSQKEHPKEHWRHDQMWWDFWSLVPESIHQVLWLMGDRGAPMGWRHMNGYGSHTFSLINEQNERIWVKFHFITDQGNKFFTDQQWRDMEGVEPRWATKDLYQAIEEPPYHVSGMAARIELDEDDHYDQARMYYDMLDDGEKERLYSNIAGSLGKATPEVIKDQMELFRQVSPMLAEQVQKAIATTEPPKPEPKPATV